MSTSKKDKTKLGWVIGIAIWLVAAVAIFYSAQNKADIKDKRVPIIDGPEVEQEVPEDARE